MTRHVTYAQFRENPAKYMDEVADGPVYIDRGAGSVLMLSQEEFDSLVEMARLLGSPANASRLLLSIKAAQAGELQEHAHMEDNVKLWSDAAWEAARSPDGAASKSGSPDLEAAKSGGSLSDYSAHFLHSVPNR